jgi:thiosulfate/3-mercaptopyruvate sulfurtransferase
MTSHERGLSKVKKLSLLFIAAILAIPFLAVGCGGNDSQPAAAAAATTAAPTTGSSPTQDPNAYAQPDLLAETSWLASRLNDRTIVVVDLRQKQAYDAGHVPGAVWYDSAKLKDPDDKFYVIRPTLFAQYAGDIGIDASKTVVAYDDNAGLNSARFWWVLSYFGQDKAKVLNGGWPKWQKENLPVSQEAPAVTKAVFTATPNDKMIATLDYVQKQSTNPGPNVVLLDVRTSAEYTGADVRSAKGGHIPKAVNLDWTLNMTTSDPKVWKSAAELRKQFEQAGVKPGMEIITYCQSGVRAAQALFTLRLLGYTNVRNYDGSWQEWGNNASTPIER